MQTGLDLGGEKQVKTILLDLNYTLVANSAESMIEPWVEPRWGLEEYELGLIEAIRHLQVVLITVRSESWRERTVANILRKTGWQPDVTHFNARRERAPDTKNRGVRRLLHEGVIGALSECLAIESNAETSRMYRDRFNIPAVRKAAFLEDPSRWLV